MIIDLPVLKGKTFFLGWSLEAYEEGYKHRQHRKITRSGRHCQNKVMKSTGQQTGQQTL